MRLPRWLYIGAGIGSALFLFLALTLWFIPDRELQALAGRALQREGYTLRSARFGKEFPLGVKAVDLEIADDRGLLLKAEKVTFHLDLLSLLRGRLAFSCRAAIGAGTTVVEYAPRDAAVKIELTGIRMEDLPFFRTVTGARVTGALRLNGHFTMKGKSPGGTLQLEAKGANVAEVKIGDISLPDADYTAIQGMVQANGAVATLNSFTLQGDGLYVRLKGTLPLSTPLGSGPLNLTLELMPKPEFLERQKFVFLLLAKYLTTPGHYEIPIRGTLAKPLIQ